LSPQHGENPPPYYLVVNPDDPPPPYTGSQGPVSGPPVITYYSNQPVPYYPPPPVLQPVAAPVYQNQPDYPQTRLVVTRHKKLPRYGGSGGLVFLLIFIGVVIWLGVRYGTPFQSTATTEKCMYMVTCEGHECKDGRNETHCVRFGSKNELQVMTVNSSSFLPVCFIGWNQNLANKTCKQLGFRGSYDYGPLVSSSSLFYSVTTQSSNTVQGKIIASSSCPDHQSVFLQCSDCGFSNVTSRIISGSVAESGEWPWQASLHFQGYHVCGGSLVAQDFIVTAAHCFSSASSLLPKNWQVYLGTVSQDMLPPPYFVAEIILHKLYNPATKDYDIALLKLSLPVRLSGTIQPVCLPMFDQVVSANRQCWTTGFGTTVEGVDVGSTMLMDVAVGIIDLSVCNNNSIYTEQVTENMLCAGDLQGGKDTCQGDSGGPLVCQEDDRHWYLFGVTSWGVGCGRRHKPGVYSNVHSLLEWIHSQMGKSSRDPTAV
ncbi:transmembrane protease serine 13b, partial [Trichomycterus rosablanca]|uniref:transmembrane protease serine 13b n=1 Tax=Trichomycterus rosablanca TaxID=2290929 RepID=UPI002F35FA1D